MQDWLNHNFGYVFPFFFLSLWLFVMYWVALLGGWRLLSRRFRTSSPFSGQKWHMQSAGMRALSHYNNALTIGADPNGLFIVPFILFRAWHPPLFVPWSDITARSKTLLFFFPMVELRLGSIEQVPFTIRASLAARLESAAGESWPMNTKRFLTSPPPPIS